MTTTDAGERLRDAAHDLLEARRESCILRLRRALLLHALEYGSATMDDARATVELPSDVDPACCGPVAAGLARAGILRSDGYRQTNRAIAHARPLTVWRVVDRQAALDWLDTHPETTEGAAAVSAAPSQRTLW